MGDWKDDEDNMEEYDKLYNELNDENDDDISLEDESDITKILDPELVEYFNEARVIKRKFPNDKSKKKKKDKIIYDVGQVVFVNNKKYTILYGPYEQNNKDMYELETEDGNVISAEYKQIVVKE